MMKKNLKIMIICMFAVLILAPFAYAYWTDMVNSHVDLNLSYNTTLNVLNVPAPPPIAMPIPEVPLIDGAVPETGTIIENTNNMGTVEIKDIQGDAEAVEVTEGTEATESIIAPNSDSKLESDSTIKEESNNNTNTDSENNNTDSKGESNSNSGSNDTDASSVTESSDTSTDSGTDNLSAESEE